MDNLTAYGTADKSLGRCPLSSARFTILDSTVPYKINAALNGTLAVVTVFANVLLFRAVLRSVSMRTSSKLLLCTLVLTDCGVGLFVEPNFAIFLTTKVVRVHSIACLSLQCYGAAGTLFAGVSLFVITAVGLDRYIALFYHLKYHEIVTTKLAVVLLTHIWAFAVFYSTTWLWNRVIWAWLTVAGVSSCLVVLSVTYIKIYRWLRQHKNGRVGVEQPRPPNQPAASNTLDVAKYRRTASTMLWIYVLFVLCYLPFFCVHFVVSSVKHSALTQCMYEFSLTLVHLSSLFNPLVCLRLPEIRAEVLKQLRNILKCCRRQSLS